MTNQSCKRVLICVSSLSTCQTKNLFNWKFYHLSSLVAIRDQMVRIDAHPRMRLVHSLYNTNSALLALDAPQLLLSYRLKRPKITHLFLVHCVQFVLQPTRNLLKKTCWRTDICHKIPDFEPPPKTGLGLLVTSYMSNRHHQWIQHSSLLRTTCETYRESSIGTSSVHVL